MPELGRERAREYTKVLISLAGAGLRELCLRQGRTDLPCVVIAPNQSTGFFIASFLSVATGGKPRVRRTRQALSEIQRILGSLRDAETPPLDPQEITQVLREVQCEDALRLCSVRRPLVICCFDASLPDYNSCYFPALNLIAVTGVRKSSSDSDPRYVLLHEVGHALQVALTKDAALVPESFYPVFELTFGGKRSAVSQEEWPDLFADCFSIAACYRKPLANINPFCRRFYRFSLEGIKAYFDMLIEAGLADIDTLVQKPWDLSWSPSRVKALCSAIGAAFD